MHLSTTLDCDLVAVETDDEITLLVELTAPTPATTAVRQPATLQVVLDRSGSMAGDRLEGAKTALLALVDRLDPSDNLGVVAFDNQVQVVVPAGPLTDKAAVKRAIAAIQDGGSTDLSSGYLRGLQEARRVAGPAGATLLLISDGHANAGVTDPQQLEKVAAQAHGNGVTTSALGFGLGYDETLLGALARGGAGNELFAEEADSAVALISGEVEGLLTQVAQAASLRLTWTDHVAGISVLNDLPVVGLPDGAMLELGSFYAGETRRLLITLKVPGIPALGLTQVATLELTHVALPELVQHTTVLPVQVNVVPGDQAAGRVPDPKVRSEVLFQQTQKAKKDSSRLLSDGPRRRGLGHAPYDERASARRVRRTARRLRRRARRRGRTHGRPGRGGRRRLQPGREDQLVQREHVQPQPRPADPWRDARAALGLRSRGRAGLDAGARALAGRAAAAGAAGRAGAGAQAVARPGARRGVGSRHRGGAGIGSPAGRLLQRRRPSTAASRSSALRQGSAVVAPCLGPRSDQLPRRRRRAPRPRRAATPRPRAVGGCPRPGAGSRRTWSSTTPCCAPA